MNSKQEHLLDGFKGLELDWDSYGALQIKPRAIERAKKFLLEMPNEDWLIIPCGNGAVQLEIHSDGFEIEVYIEDVT